MADGIKKTFVTLIVTALGLAMAFFWYDAILKWFEPIVGGEDAVSKTIVAVIVTVVAIIIIFLINWLFYSKDKRACEARGMLWKDNSCKKE